MAILHGRLSGSPERLIVRVAVFSWGIYILLTGDLYLQCIDHATVIR
jgi:hypothetical protein